MAGNRCVNTFYVMLRYLAISFYSKTVTMRLVFLQSVEGIKCSYSLMKQALFFHFAGKYGQQNQAKRN